MDILKNGQDFLKKHQYPPILFEAWATEDYREQREMLMTFLSSLGYEILQLDRMDYVAQHPLNDRYFIREQTDNAITYRMIKR
ncbi:hypothetical protein [Moraxella oblonga]|uniref:hypothetical protein n=1 Tax=Moraxella oblonga TaxID=200413 RepID=UPI00082ADE1A|nr:hypothetical protein [Moraxella oblonga]